MEFRLIFKVLTSQPRLEATSLRTNVAFLDEIFVLSKADVRPGDRILILARLGAVASFLLVLVPQVLFPLHPTSGPPLSSLDSSSLEQESVSSTNWLVHAASSSCALFCASVPLPSVPVHAVFDAYPPCQLHQLNLDVPSAFERVESLCLQEWRSL